MALRPSFLQHLLGIGDLGLQGMVARAFNPSAQEAEAGGSLSSRLAVLKLIISGLELRETLSGKTKNKTTKTPRDPD